MKKLNSNKNKYALINKYEAISNVSLLIILNKSIKTLFYYILYFTKCYTDIGNIIKFVIH